jgi:hypothetical protein
VIGDVAGDRLVAMLRRAPRGVVLPRELPGRFDRLGATGAEERAVEVSRRERGHVGSQLDRAGVRVRPVGVEGQLSHLLERGLADLLSERVTDVHGEEPCERVQVPLPVRVLEVAPVAADDYRDLRSVVSAHAREVHPQVLFRCLLQIDGHRAHALLAPRFRRAPRSCQRTLASASPIATRKRRSPRR